MDAFYAGIDNPLSITVSGVPLQDIEISVTNGTAVRIAEWWNIRPIKVNVESVVTVTALINGKRTIVCSKTFQVKPLPNPSVRLLYHPASGVAIGFRGGTIAKNELLSATRVFAMLDDLDVQFKVLSFSLNYTDSNGNVLSEHAEGAELTARQLNILRGLAVGKSVYITNVIVVGPDYIQRKLQTLAITLK